MGIEVNDLFGLKAVPLSTEAELNARLTPKIQEWHAVRKPWAHVMSLSDKCAGDASTQFGLKFGPDGGKGYITNYERPQPTLENLQVKKQGELGTTRRVILEIKAYTDDQLNEIARCYFIPDMSVRVQWGWNVGASGERSPQPYRSFTRDGSISDPIANREIANIQSKYANYDGLQGRVVHYNMTLDSDNVWNISIEIVGASTMMTDAKINDYSNGCNCKITPEPGPDGETKDPQETPTSRLRAVFENLIDKPDTFKSAYGGKSGETYKIRFKGYDIDDSGTEVTETSFWRVKISDREQVFISFGGLQRLVSCTTQNLSDTTKEPLNYEFVSDGVYITAPVDDKNKNLVICSDPRVGFIPGGDLSDRLSLNTLAPSAYDKEKGILLDNVLINVNYCRRLLSNIEEGADSVSQYLLKVLEDFNYKCGSPWDFGFIDTSNSAPALKATNAPIRITVVDTKKSKKNTKPYRIEAAAEKSHVRSLSIDLKLTESMKTQALYSGTLAEAPNTKVVCNKSFAAFTKVSAYGINTAVKNSTNISKEGCGTSGDKCTDKKSKTSYEDAIKNLKNGVTDETVAAVRGELINKITSNKDANCKGSLIPINFGVTLDGIGGFSFGQSIDCSRFPKGWSEYFTYQVTVVEHSITHDDWQTTLTTAARLI